MDKVKRTRFLGRTNLISLMGKKKRKRERKRIQPSFHDPRSSVNRNSSGQEPKFIVSTRVTLGYQKRRISSKIRRKRFWEIGFFGIRRCSRDLLQFYYAQRGRDSSYIDLFLLLWTDLYLRGCLARFYALRGCLAWVKTPLIVVLQPVCSLFCVLICGYV